MLVPNPNALRRAMRIYFQGSRGGPPRLRILLALEKKLMNINQISRELSIDYKTAQYHVRNLEKSGIVTSSGKGYDNPYVISALLANDKAFLKELKDMGKSK